MLLPSACLKGTLSLMLAHSANACPGHLEALVLSVGAFHERHRHPVPKPGALQTAGDSPGGFWDKRVLLVRFSAFSLVLSLLSSAFLNDSLSPCGPPMGPCHPVVFLVSSARDTSTLLHSMGHYSALGKSWELLGWERPPWKAPSIPCGLDAYFFLPYSTSP